VAKLINEGYTGHLIRTTIDDAAGPGVGAESVIDLLRPVGIV
jgi:hypothetical protein